MKNGQHVRNGSVEKLTMYLEEAEKLAQEGYFIKITHPFFEGEELEKEYPHYLNWISEKNMKNMEKMQVSIMPT